MKMFAKAHSRVVLLKARRISRAKADRSGESMYFTAECRVIEGWK